MRSGLAGMTVPGAAGTIALVATLGLGLLPGVAMTAGGLTGLDDGVIEGGTVRRPDAAAAVAATHRGLNGACLALGAVIGAAGYRLGATPDGWAMGLAAAVAVVVVLRARLLPLAPQRLAVPPRQRFARLDVLKFQAVMRPGAAVRMALDWQPASCTLAFRLTSDAGSHASGKIVFHPAVS